MTQFPKEDKKTDEEIERIALKYSDGFAPGLVG